MDGIHGYPRDLIKRLLQHYADLEEVEAETTSETLIVMKCDIDKAIEQARGRVDMRALGTLIAGGWDFATNPKGGGVTQAELEASIEELHYILNVEGLE